MVRLLLHHAADVERVNDNGQTALGAAVFRRSADIVPLGADDTRTSCK
jgi:ankyrin repeat protein